ncbi:MAG: TonB-dependent receptor, partial [Bacteroidota bacterium]
NFTFFLEDSLNGDQIRQRERRFLTGYRGTWTHQNTLLNRPIRLQTGVSLRLDGVKGSELSHTLNRYTVLHRHRLGDIREQNAAAFTEARWQLSDRTTLFAGLRYDRFRFRYSDALTDAYDHLRAARGIASPKLRLQYHARPSLLLYAAAGTGFHSNDARVVLQETGRDILPAAVGADLGLLWKPEKEIVVQAALWQLHMQQEFVYVGDAGIVDPGGRTDRFGLDLSVRARLLPSVFVDADLNLSRARARDAGTAVHIPLAPTVTSSGGLRWAPGGRWAAAMRYRHLAARPANESWTLTAEGYFLLDATLSYTFRRVQLSLAATNLLNAEWNAAQFETTSRLRHETAPVTEVHFTPGSPRALNLSLSLQL